MSTCELESSSKKFVIKNKKNTDVGPFDLKSKENPRQPIRQVPMENAEAAIQDFEQSETLGTEAEEEREDLLRALGVLSSNNDFAMASKVANRVLEFQDLSVQELKDLLFVYERSEDLVGQEAVLVRLLDNQSISAEDRFEFQKNLGNTLLRLQDFEGAEEHYFKAFGMNSKSDTLLVNIGTLEFRKNEHQSAKERFVQAIELNRDNDKAWVGLGLVHSVFGDFSLALGNFETALDINSENRTALQLYCEYAYKHGSLQKMLEHIENYIETGHRDVEMLMTAAKVSLILGAKTNSASYANQVVEIDSSHQEALQLLQLTDVERSL